MDTARVRMAERSKALRSGRSPLLWAWVRIPLLTNNFSPILQSKIGKCISVMDILFRTTTILIAEWRSGSVLGP